VSRAHLYRTVQSVGGALVSGASVTVCEAGTSTPILQTPYTTETGPDTLSNPFLATDGVIDFYLDNAQNVDLIISYGSSTLTVEQQPVLPPAGELFAAGSPVTVTNGPSTGYVLAGVDLTHAHWVDPATIVPGSVDAPMPQPSAPTIGAANGMQLILWDGNDSTGTPMPAGFDYIEVATDLGVVIGSMKTAGGIVPTVEGPFDFTLRAFNQAGNSGDPTDLFTYPPYVPPTFSGPNQSTVGAAGTAQALPTLPSTYLFVTDDDGAQWVIPAYTPVAAPPP
jgi:hypothetical protein